MNQHGHADGGFVDTVAQALAEAERVAEAHTVNDPEAHGEPEEDRQRDAVGLTLELRE